MLLLQLPHFSLWLCRGSASVRVKRNACCIKLANFHYTFIIRTVYVEVKSSLDSLAQYVYSP